MKILRFTALLLAVAVLFSVSASAASRIPVYRVDDALLFFDKSTGEITGFAGEPGWLTIPEYIAGYKVTAIGRSAFSDCRSLRKVVISEGITSIGEKAFYNCQGLMAAVIPASVSSVGDSAFRGCSALSDITFNGAIEKVATNAFDGTIWRTGNGEDFVIAGKTLLLHYGGSDENVTVPQGVTHIAANAFAYNTTLKSVVLPEGVKEIGDNAFVHCYSLADISFPSTIAFVGVGAFDDTIWLRSRTEEFVSINGVLVAYNGNDGYVSVPDGITSIGSGVFMSNEKIFAVSLPDSLRTINEAAFGSSSSISAVIIPDGVEWIDDYAFTGSESVTLFGSENSYAQYYAQLNGLNFSKPIGVDIDGSEVSFDVSPVIICGSAYVPMRAVLERMGLSVQWNAAGREVIVSDSETIITAYVESTEITVNGEARSIAAPPIMLRGRVLLPVRDFAEIFGFNVGWDNTARRVVINSEE